MLLVLSVTTAGPSFNLLFRRRPKSQGMAGSGRRAPGAVRRRDHAKARSALVVKTSVEGLHGRGGTGGGNDTTRGHDTCGRAGRCNLWVVRGRGCGEREEKGAARDGMLVAAARTDSSQNTLL
jgi:hypothetical protein